MNDKYLKSWLKKQGLTEDDFIEMLKSNNLVWESYNPNAKMRRKTPDMLFFDDKVANLKDKL